MKKKYNQNSASAISETHHGIYSRIILMELVWGKLNPETEYVLDLIQKPSGKRFTRFRLPSAPAHEGTVLQSKPYKGAILKEFVVSLQISTEIVTTDGQRFGIDAHNIWLTMDEAVYLHKKYESHGKIENLDPPWVNGIPPIFPPA